MSRDTIIGIVGGAILGLIITHFYYRIQKRRRELCWSEDSTSLIKGYSSLFEKLEIQYGGQKIENLTVSKIAFWNNGNETIDRTDLAIPPYIVPNKEDTKMLDVKVIKTSAVGNQFRAEIIEQDEERFIRLDFDYLDGQQGAVIQVIHTGVSVLPLLVDGEIKGVKEIEYKSKRLNFHSRMARIILYFYTVSGFVLMGIVAYNSIFREIPARSDWSVWLLVIAMPLMAVVVISDIRQMRDTAKIPKELSVFEKDDIGINKRQ